MDIYFTSDLHLGHKNIIEYSKRPFSSVEEMNEAIIERWTKTVKPGDQIYFLGDFALCKEDIAIPMLKRLTGQKFIVFGNHDKYLRKSKIFLEYWAWAKDHAEIKIGDQKIVLNHYAFRTWNQMHRGSYNFHGHSHGSLPELDYLRQCDVGVDCWNYTPVNYDELKLKMDKKVFQAVDHHEER